MNRLQCMVAGVLLGVPVWVHAADSAAEAALATKPESQPPHCLQQTGSRIPPQPGRCQPVAGRVITRDQIERSGAQDVSEAIRLLQR